MKVQFVWEDSDRLIVTCSGELGWDAQDELVKRVTEAVAGRRPHVVIDLEAVEVITSAGLGSILQIRKRVGEQDGRLVLACASPQISQLFTTVGLDRHIQMADTLESARELLTQPIG